MSYRDDLKSWPHRFDLFKVLRELERSTPHKPRIGDSAVVSEEVVSLAQDPFLAFPDTNISAVDETAAGTLRIHTRFLGFFGPQGALPLMTTFEAYGWLTTSPYDPSFARFVDLFGNRFQQLFFRAWSDARPLTQYDRPKQDRFARYLGSFGGIGSDPFVGRDEVEDIAKLPFMGLVASRIKGSRRLAQLLRGVFHLDASIVERVGSWLVFEPSDQMSVGARGASLGLDTFLGLRSYSINDKFRITIKAVSLEQYQQLLPSGVIADKIADLVFFYVGHRYEYDVELSLPARLAPPAQLGVSGQLGWTSWVAPRKGPEVEDVYYSDARFNLSERRMAAHAARREKQKVRAGQKR